jgi:hypothetical protein
MAPPEAEPDFVRRCRRWESNPRKIPSAVRASALAPRRPPGEKRWREPGRGIFDRGPSKQRGNQRSSELGRHQRQRTSQHAPRLQWDLRRQRGSETTRGNAPNPGRHRDTQRPSFPCQGKTTHAVMGCCGPPQRRGPRPRRRRRASPGSRRSSAQLERQTLAWVSVRECPPDWENTPTDEEAAMLDRCLVERD